MDVLFIILYIVLLISSFLLEKKIYKCHYTPLTFFVCIWCVVGIVANLGLYDYYLPSTLVNVVILISNICVMIIFIIFTANRASLIRKIRFNIVKIDYSLDVLIVMEILWFILIFPKLKSSFSILKNYNMAMLRGAEIYNISDISGMTSTLIEVFVKSGYTVISIIAIVSIFSNVTSKKRNILWIANIFNITVFTIATAGRVMIVNSLFYFIITVVIYKGSSIKSFIVKEKKKMIPLVLLVIALLYMQEQRSEDMGVLETFYMYYFSGPSFLTQLLEANKNLFSINNDFMFGSATFGFLTNIFSYILIFLTGIPQGSLYKIGSVLTNKNLLIGANTELNAMCTCFYNFMLDWGYIGILIGACFIVVAAVYFYFNAAKSNSSYANICILVFFINVLIRTIFKWDLLSTDLIMIILYLKVFNYTKNIRIRM